MTKHKQPVDELQYRTKFTLQDMRESLVKDLAQLDAILDDFDRRGDYERRGHVDSVVMMVLGFPERMGMEKIRKCQDAYYDRLDDM